MAFRISRPVFQLALRSRFALGLGAVLLPFFVAAMVGQFYLLPSLIEPLEDIVRELTQETQPVTRLQVVLLQSTMPVNDYLIHGDPGERQQFTQLQQRVERAFQEASPEQFTLEAERRLIISARAQWEQARRLGAQLMQLPDPVGNAIAQRDMERFDVHIDRAVSALDEMNDQFRRTLDHDRLHVRIAGRTALWVSFVAFALSIAVSLFAGVALARSITDPVDTLRHGAERLAEGDLSHRVNMRRSDELGELATAFNSMAERIEANQAALAELATHDGLSGLYNQRTFYVLLGDELARAHRFKHQVSLLLLDIDHFKHVNDMHGHLAGDAVLKGLSELLRREVRAVDRVCRYGGEEITVILPETDPAAAACFAERLRAAVEAQPFDVAADKPLRITVSIGIASWPADAANAMALVAAADAAMYAAKQRGRNLAIRYEPALG